VIGKPPGPTDAVKRRVEFLLGQDLSSLWDADQQVAWAGFLEISRLLSGMHDREMISKHGLSLTLLSLLGRLNECDATAALQARDLAVDLDLSPGRVSRHLATLEDEGLLIRSHSTTDGRALDVELTDAGRARLAGARQTAHEIVERDFLSYLTPTETATLARIASKILQAANVADT
jgi:DNA-binding MarR family transcriptional regulator